MKVPAWKMTGGMAWAFLVALALLLALPGTVASLTLSGSVIVHDFTVRYATPVQREVRSNETRVNVRDLSAPELVPPRSAATRPGVPVDFLHTLTNRGNFPDSFRLTAAQAGGGLPDPAPPPLLRFYAADGVTPLPEGTDGVQVIGPVAPGASVELVLRGTPAAGSEGRVLPLTVTAASVLQPARSSALVDQLVVPAQGGLAALKGVTPEGSVLPGATLAYRIAVTNATAAPVNGVRVVDPLDPLLEYQAGSATLPAGLTGTASYDPGTRSLVFDLSGVPAGFSGELSYLARVREEAPANASIVNTAAVSSAADPATTLTNSTLNTVLGRALEVRKTAGASVAEAGDLVSYQVRVENVGAAALNGVTLEDRLPRGFRYLKGSTRIAGVTAADPAGGSQQLSWELVSLAPGEARELSYRVVVTPEAPVGTGLNRARARGVTEAGSVSLSPEARAAVKVRPGVLSDRAIIMGRVFEDGNGNWVPDRGEAGVAGVRVYLEDGSYVYTDGEGKYSFTGLAPGDHVLKLDRVTLEPGLEPVPYNTAFAGVGWSQFVTVPFGGPARGDFGFRRRPLEAGTAGTAGAAEIAGAAGPAAATRTSPTGSLAFDPTAPPPAAPPAARLRLAPERLELPADNATTVPFQVELLDPTGSRVAGPATVTVILGKGTLVEPDLAPALPGHQVSLSDGFGVFRVRSTRLTGEDRLLVLTAAGPPAAADLYFTPELRDWILVGLGSLTVGAKAVSGNLERIDGDDRFDEGIFHEERLAFFTRGRILGKYLLTAAYDSDKERRDGVFQAIDPEKYYPVYGDASDIGYEAQSRGKLYLRLESGRSYLMAGDYHTDLSNNEFSRYDRALNGVKFEVDGKAYTMKGFESEVEETQARDDIPGNGTSGHYLLSRRPLFENSERVRIEVRDRYHTERVISAAEKIRYADYTIDYSAGTILFKQPVPSLDQDLNPVTIVVTYQASGPGEKRRVYGGRGEVRLPEGVRLGGTAVVEEHALKDSTLYGLDAAWRLSERLSFSGEGAVSETLERGRGSAWKTELSARPTEPLGVGLYYRRVEADFANSSMSASELGTEKYGARADYRLPANAILMAESFVERYETAGRKLVGNHAGLSRRFSLIQAEGGVKLMREEEGGETERADLVYAGVKSPLTPRLDATLRREQLLSASGIADYQTKTFLKLDYRLNDRVKAFVTEEYQEGSPAIRHATLFGLEGKLSERMRLAAGTRLADGITGFSQQSSVDLHTRLAERDGFRLDSRSGYQLEHALSRDRGQAILGLDSRYRLAEGLYVNSSLERVQRVQGIGGTRTAFTLAGEYLRQRDLKLTGRYEVRTGPEETAYLYGAGAAWKATPSLTLLSKVTLWDRDTDLGDDLVFDGYLGSSFRPVTGNPWQLLTLARYKIEERGTVPGSDSRSLVLSAEPTWRLVSRLSAQGKYAGKITRSTYTDLALAGLSYDLAERWELALYLKLLNQYDARLHSLGAVGSAGYRVHKNVVLSAGYNYARLDDRDLTGESYQGQGPYVGVKVKFDEEMFESAQPIEVPLPPPPAPVAVEPPAAAPVRVPVPALYFTAKREDEPLVLSGSAELFTMLVNGEAARLPSTEVTLRRERLGSLKLNRGRLSSPLGLVVSVEEPGEIASFRLRVMDREGEVLKSIAGKGAPPPRIDWGGETDRHKVEKGEIYQCQLEVTYRDGSVFMTGRELFGVNRDEALILTLAGGAFVFDKSYLTPEARRLLKGAARVLREHTHQKVVLEGHTDGIGSAPYNVALSKRRCDAAADYLVRVEGIDPARLVRRWYGKSRPVAGNTTTPGRRLNRRVEIKGEFEQVIPVGPDDRYRSAPFVTVNGQSIPVDPMGRYAAVLPGSTSQLKVEMGDSLGRFLATTLPLPDLALASPRAEGLVPHGLSEGGVSVDAGGSARCILSGRLEPGTSLEISGDEVEVDGEGRFKTELPLAAGERVIGLVLRNRTGCSKLLNLRLKAEQRADAAGVAP